MILLCYNLTGDIMYKYIYKTNDHFDDIILLSDGLNLTGLYFINSYTLPKDLINYKYNDLDIFKNVSLYLDNYFNGLNPKVNFNYKLNISSFAKEVLDILISIPYGTTITYGDIAKSIASKRNVYKMSAQAVGHAVGTNPLSIIIPCHRVVGSNNNLVGYSGKIKNKVELLKLEGVDINKSIIPKKGKKL